MDEAERVERLLAESDAFEVVRQRHKAKKRREKAMGNIGEPELMSEGQIREMNALEDKIQRLTKRAEAKQRNECGNPRRDVWRSYFASLLGHPTVVTVEDAVAEADKALEADDARWAEKEDDDGQPTG